MEKVNVSVELDLLIEAECPYCESHNDCQSDFRLKYEDNLGIVVNSGAAPSVQKVCEYCGETFEVVIHEFI